jgi:hypothetical protein
MPYSGCLRDWQFSRVQCASLGLVPVSHQCQRQLSAPYLTVELNSRTNELEALRWVPVRSLGRASTVGARDAESEFY